MAVETAGPTRIPPHSQAKSMCAVLRRRVIARAESRAGFMLAPLLYMLALAGIGAAVMFSGYSQVLRSNAEMTAINTARQQLQSAGQTLSATSVLDQATSSIRSEERR